MRVRQSTARTILVGPVLDEDGVAKTNEVVASIKITKNGTVGALHGSATLTHDHTGKYLLALTVNDFDTVGVTQFSLNSGTNEMPVCSVNVVEEAVFDMFYAASATGLHADWINDGRLDLLLDAIPTGVPLDAAGFRTAIGLGSANLDTQLTALSEYVDCLPATLDGSTFTSLPAVTTDAASRTASKADVSGLATTVQLNARTLLAASYATAAICTEVRLAELDAANLPADVSAIPTTKTGYALSEAGNNAVADAYHNRAIQTDPTEKEYTARFAILMQMNANLVDNDGFLTVFDTADNEIAQLPVTSDSVAEAITGVS